MSRMIFKLTSYSFSLLGAIKQSDVLAKKSHLVNPSQLYLGSVLLE